MRIDELARDKFLITVELNPPACSRVDSLLADFRKVKDLVDAVNITDMPGANLKMSSWGAGLWVMREGGNPIVQYTCRDRNRLALKGDVLALESFGIDNLLVLGGDPPRIGDHPEAKVVYDFDTVGFMRWISENTSICVGGAVNPGAEDFSVEREKVKAKIDAGARFFQTQAVYDKEAFFSFMDRVQELRSVPVIVGIIPLRSEKMALFMNENIPGIKVPDEIISRISSAEDKVKCGIEIALEIINQIKGYCDGIHIMPIRSVDTAVALIERLKGGREEL